MFASPASGLRIPRTDIPAHLLAPAGVPRLLFYATSEWLTILLAWIAMAHAPAWLYPAGVLIVAGRLHALGVVLHDACHMPKRSTTSWLWPLELFAGYPLATTRNALRYHHLRHHRDSGMPTDPYLKLGASHSAMRRNLLRLRGLLLIPVWTARAYYGCLALVVPRLRTSYGRVFLQDRSGADLTGDREVLACLREEPKQALFFLAVGGLAACYPLPVLLYYMVPLIVAGLLNVNRVIIEHVHVCCHDRRPETVIATTVTHAWGSPGKLFLFPRNIGFHVIHHLHPQVALHCLPELHRWYADRAAASERT